MWKRARFAASKGKLHSECLATLSLAARRPTGSGAFPLIHRMTKPLIQENISAMAASMFSFLDDTALYGEGRSQHPKTPLSAGAGQMAPPMRPASSQDMQPASAPEIAKPATPPLPRPPPPCLDERGLNQVMDSLQARILSAEKRTALMEQRLLSALDDCQSRRPPAQSGCSWPVFVFVVFIFLGILLFSIRGAAQRGTCTRPPAPCQSCFPAACRHRRWSCLL